MGWYADTIKRLGHAPWVSWIGSRIAHRIDVPLYRLSGGAVTLTGRPVAPTLLLTTTGRRSGHRRTVPVLYARDGADFIVAGSSWGRRMEPAWAKNLVADEHARVQIGRQQRDVVARIATAEESKRLWPLLDREWPAYRTYRARSGRVIKVFVLRGR